MLIEETVLGFDVLDAVYIGLQLGIAIDRREDMDASVGAGMGEGSGEFCRISWTPIQRRGVRTETLQLRGVILEWRTRLMAAACESASEWPW